MQCFFKSAPTLHTVSLRECDSVTDDGIALLAKNCPSLHSINISKCCQLTGRCLHALAKVCLGRGGGLAKEVVSTTVCTKGIVCVASLAVGDSVWGGGVC